MNRLIIEPLSYQENSSITASLFQHWPHFAYLDSCQPNSELGRYDIISANPDYTLTTLGQATLVNVRGNTHESPANPFSLVRQALAHYGPAPTVPVDIPFAGGAMGYFGYDLGRRIEKIGNVAKADIAMADMQVGIYLWAIVVDHQQKRSNLIFHPRCSDFTKRQVYQQLESAAARSAEFHLDHPFQKCISQEQYNTAFNKIENYIAAGDCYQVNFTQRFESSFSGNPWGAYTLLREYSPAPWAAFLSHNNHAILSFSPERFVRVARGLVETKPIKGTAPRGDSPEQDKQLADTLQASSKDRAENLMIVDLLRNDLGKSCLPGSIKVSKLFALESFSNVHHLVSTIRGQLAPQKHALDLLRGCFPGGSITGAPKRRAMEIIDELERYRRNLYCGSIAYIGFDGNMDSNIAIRTLVCEEEKMYCWAGGGIVADSNAAGEYQESLDKIQRLLTGLEDTLA